MGKTSDQDIVYISGTNRQQHNMVSRSQDGKCSIYLEPGTELVTAIITPHINGHKNRNLIDFALWTRSLGSNGGNLAAHPSKCIRAADQYCIIATKY